MRKAAFSTVLGGAAAGVAALAAWAGGPGPAFRIEHARALTTVVTDVSSNWAGYVATGIGSTSTTASSSMAYTDVTGQWTQPSAICTPGSSSSAALWVGLGGYSTSAQELEQAGTSADCDRNGKATYYAWYELVPADSVNVKLKINPGDVIAATVCTTDGSSTCVANGTDILVQVKDRTRHTSFTKHLQMSAHDLTSAEWIIEAPALCGSSGSCSEIPLTNFGTVNFSRTYARGNNIPGTITNSNWMSTAIQLVPESSRPSYRGNDQAAGNGAGALPGSLAADGSGFTVTWQANPATG